MSQYNLASEKEILDNLLRIKYVKTHLHALKNGNNPYDLPVDITVAALEKSLHDLRIETCIKLESLKDGAET
jgi:hypothetical protein